MVCQSTKNWGSNCSSSSARRISISSSAVLMPCRLLPATNSPANSLVFCDETLRMVLGGNGANCAYALAALGAETALCSAVGVDELGRLVTELLQANGVNLTGLVHSADRATAYTTIVADRAQNRLAFHHPGALAGFTLADVPIRPAGPSRCGVGGQLYDLARVAARWICPTAERCPPARRTDCAGYWPRGRAACPIG